MRSFLGGLCIIGGALLALYLAFYVCLFGGLVQIGTALKQADPSVVNIALGIVRVLCSSLVGWVAFILCALTGRYFLTTSPRRRGVIRNPWDRGWTQEEPRPLSADERKARRPLPLELALDRNEEPVKLTSTEIIRKVRNSWDRS